MTQPTATEYDYPSRADLAQCIAEVWSEAQTTDDDERHARLKAVANNLLELWARS